MVGAHAECGHGPTRRHRRTVMPWTEWAACAPLAGRPALGYLSTQAPLRAAAGGVDWGVARFATVTTRGGRPCSKALVFDVDGTLADTEQTHRAAYNAAFVEHGLGWYWTHQRYASLLAVSGGQARLRHAIRSQAMGNAERTRLLRLVPALHATKTRLYSEFVAAGRVHLRPGIARLISEARAAGPATGAGVVDHAGQYRCLVERQPR
jgi:hypothetical protein